MDPLHLLTRSSKRPKAAGKKAEAQVLPSAGAPHNPQLFGRETLANGDAEVRGHKRKRGGHATQTNGVQSDSLNFFGGAELDGAESADGSLEVREAHARSDGHGQTVASEARVQRTRRTLDECKGILRQHKLKIAVLQEPNAASAKSKKRKKKVAGQGDKAKQNAGQQLYPDPLLDFRHLQTTFRISGRLARNIEEQGYKTPTEVQMASLPLLLGGLSEADHEGRSSGSPEGGISHIDLLTVAPTGSGKTLAFMIPLIQRLVERRHNRTENSLEGTKAIILAPTKELASQIVNEGRKLAMDTGIRVSGLKKGMRLGHDGQTEENAPVVKSDVLVSTPLTLVHALKNTKGSNLSTVRHLILDEADVLLDPLFRDQTLSIWNSVSNPDLRVSLWSATMGSNVEVLARQVITSRASTIASSTGLSIPSAPLVRLVVGLKDSAVPNISHQLTYAATEQGKLMALRQLLHPTSTDVDSKSPPLRAPFLVFTQTIERAIALHSELKYDIPVEAGGISRIAVLHSDLSDAARDDVMTRFRKGEVWVLITTDLLSRGVDFRGMNGVVNYDVPTSSAAYVHRVGRTGRAGREGGVAVTLYTKEDIPYIKNVANVIAAAQKQRKGDQNGGDGVQQWLLDALPDVSKRDKQMLKKRGVEARRSAPDDAGKGKKVDKARISTKSGFEKKLENNRRAAIEAGKKRQQVERGARIAAESDSDSEFGGFDG